MGSLERRVKVDTRAVSDKGLQRPLSIGLDALSAPCRFLLTVWLLPITPIPSPAHHQLPWLGDHPARRPGGWPPRGCCCPTPAGLRAAQRAPSACGRRCQLPQPSTQQHPGTVCVPVSMQRRPAQYTGSSGQTPSPSSRHWGDPLLFF